MHQNSKIIVFIILALVLPGILTIQASAKKRKSIKAFLIGDSTVADYSLEDNYKENRFPITGWGQVFQSFLNADSLFKVRNLIKADEVVVDDRAKGGRSTRTFFQEGRWRAVYEELQPGDLVLMQFGHNDGAENKPERYVNIEGYKEFLRLYVQQTREKGGIPILLTPVNRNYPWKDGKLSNVHGEYPQAVKEIAEELNVLMIDLTQRSCALFTSKGKDYITTHYFMNLPAGVYPAYPDGKKDNTHFQPEGANAVALLIFEGMQELMDKSPQRR